MASVTSQTGTVVAAMDTMDLFMTKQPTQGPRDQAAVEAALADHAAVSDALASMATSGHVMSMHIGLRLLTSMRS